MKKTHKIVIGTLSIVGLILILSVVSIGLSVRSFFSTGFSSQADQQFGDQNLKTALALIELHRVRYGSYPDTLNDLQFTGDWDQMAIHSVLYIPSEDHTRYYLEVERGWVGKPSLILPDEFWQGTGYDPSLKSEK
jgi:hypothetical protein